MTDSGSASPRSARALRGELRAEVVGSLLRPGYLREGRERLRRGALSAQEMTELEDRAVRECLRLQEEAGLDVATDGEMRREIFFAPFSQACEGITESPAWRARWHTPGGEDVIGWSPPVSVTGRLRRVRSFAGAEYAYAASHTELPVKVTLPSPLMLSHLWSPELSPKVYPDPFELFADGVTVLREEIHELVGLGCRYIQIDAPELAAFDTGKEDARRFAEISGLPVERMVERAAGILNSVVRGFEDVLFAIHICRGNNQGMWIASGGYDRLVADILGDLDDYGTFLLEYDTDRAGTFEPLDGVPADKQVVLGLVSSKVPDLEPPAALRERILQAARHVPLDRLALSTQCGFASEASGNPVDAEAQRRKLELVAGVAREVWGS